MQKMKVYINIKKLDRREPIPMKLLSLTDLSQEIVESHIDRAQCFVAEVGETVIDIYVLLPTRPVTLFVFMVQY